MNKLENSEDFLNDLSGGGLPDEFADQAGKLAWQAARNRVRSRRAVHGGLATVALAGAVLLLWPREVERPIPPMVQAPAEPKTAGLEIRSVPLGNVIRSESLPPEVIVASVSGGFAVVETAPERNYAELTDEELLSFFEDRKVMLVKSSGDSAELLFIPE